MGKARAIGQQRGDKGTAPLLFAECSVRGGAARLNCIVRGRWSIANGRCRAPDAAGNEGRARNRKGDCAANLALPRELARNRARLESRQGSMRGKVKREGWDDGFLGGVVILRFTAVQRTFSSLRCPYNRHSGASRNLCLPAPLQ